MSKVPGMPRSMRKAAECAEIHRLLANPRRLMIVWLLEQKERSVGELAEAIGASLQSTSQHLRLMREHGLVGSRREGQTIYYAIEGQVSPGTALRLEPVLPDGRQEADQTESKTQIKEKTHV
jgi:DNA-binding transcriptional ArsR family regulator